MGKVGKLSIPGRFDRVSELCEFVAGGAEKAGFDADDVFRIQLACDEACTNIIQHAYGGENGGEIRVSWRYTADAFIITFRDNGRPFDPQNVPQPNLPSNPNDIDDLRIGGLGIHFMRTLMDEVRFSFDKLQGNTLVMVKYLLDKAKE